MEPNSATKRVELESDRWADVRRIRVADIAASRTHKHERGWDDDELDAIFLLPRVIVACSDGEIGEFVDTLTESDYARIWITAKGSDVPNLSSPSSDGSSRRRGKGPSNG